MTPEFFNILGIPLRKGRLFDDRDTRTTPLVAVVNERLSKQLFEGDALGRKLNLAPAGRPDILEVVGVVRDIRDVDPSRPPQPTFYMPFQQANFIPRTVLLIRASVDPNSIVRTTRDAVSAVDENAPMFEVLPLRDVVSRNLAEPRFTSFVFGLFGALSVVLALIGIYGLVSYSVADRLPEFGVRLALGAQKKDVLRQIFTEGVYTVGWGLTFGVAAALALGRFLSSRLFDIASSDLGTHLAVAALLVVVSAVGYYAPARRAMSVSPLAILKRD